MRRLLLTLVILTLAGSGVACARRSGATSPEPVEAPVLSAEVSRDDRAVVLTVGGDPCSTVRKTEVKQQDSDVVVAVYLAGPETPRPGCEAMTATTYEVPIRLDKALGDRRIVTRAGSAVVTRRA